MTVTARVLIESKQAETAQTTQYTASVDGVRTIIDKFTATNTGASAASISVNLLGSGGTAGSGNTIVKTKSLAAGEAYTFPEIVGHILESGGFISTLASASSTITIRACGREVTN